MSKKSAEEFFEKLASDAALLKQVQDLKSVADIRAIAKTRGYDFTDEEYLAQSALQSSGSDLSDDQLNAVVGGEGSVAPHTKGSSCSFTVTPCTLIKEQR